MKFFFRTLVKTRRMVFWQICRKWNFDKSAGNEMPKHQKVPLLVTNSKKVALLESVVCLIKVLQNRRSYERQMEWKYFAECPKLFFVSYFLGKHFFLITCFWTRSMRIYQICLKFLRRSWGFPDRRSKLTNTKNIPLETFLLR